MTNDVERVVIRKAFICIHCEGVYSDEPVSQCDCLEGTGHDFIEGKIEYTALVLPRGNRRISDSEMSLARETSGVKRVVMRRSDIFNEYLARGFDDVMCFPDYLEARMLEVNVTEE